MHDIYDPPPAPVPPADVPTLILSGAQDLRTPTSGARQVGALIPGAQIEVVPFTGHSVVGSDLTGCAAKAVSAFFSGAAVAPCTGARDVLAPTPVADRMKYVVFDARIPPMDQTVFPTPRVNAWESTNRTAGPGVMHSTVSMTKKALQTCQVMTGS